MSLTGRLRYRIGLFGRLVLQVEETYRDMIFYGNHCEGTNVRRWRDARATDLTPPLLAGSGGAA